jgi:hypothetical protein
MSNTLPTGENTLAPLSEFSVTSEKDDVDYQGGYWNGYHGKMDNHNPYREDSIYGKRWRAGYNAGVKQREDEYNS